LSDPLLGWVTEDILLVTDHAFPEFERRGVVERGDVCKEKQSHSGQGDGDPARREVEVSVVSSSRAKLK